MAGFHLIMSPLSPGQVKHAWRLPHVDPRAYLDIDYFTRLAKIAEDAKIDALFLGDGPALRRDIGVAPDTGLDPMILLGAMAARTENLGIVATASTTYNSPYNFARRFNALDHVTKGRAGVNVVTTGNALAAANFGLTEHPDKELRYRRGYEFMDVVTKLWDAWGPELIVADKRSGTYTVAEKIRPIDHEGEFFSVRGPLPVPAGPQGRPVVVQAGASEGGLNLAANFADVVFTVSQTRKRAIDFRDDMRRRAGQAGRSPDDIKISLGTVIIVGKTEEDAKRREQELYATLPVEKLAGGVLAGLGLSSGRFGLDDPISAADLPDAVPESAFSEGFGTALRALIAEQPRTPRELVQRSAGSSGHRLVVGSPREVADDLEAWFRDGAADGFTIMPADTAVDFVNFAQLVVPILQERGLFQRSYGSPLLRTRLGCRSGAPVTAPAAVPATAG